MAHSRFVHDIANSSTVFNNCIEILTVRVLRSQ